MRLYKISTSVQNFSEGNTHLPGTLYVGSQSDAAAARKTFTDLGAKRKDIESVEVDVPTDKAGLMAFLNELVS